MEGNAMIREIDVENGKKKLTLKVEPKDGGVELTHTCENVSATRIFSRV